MVFGVANDNVPMRESLKNLIRAVGLQAEVFISAQRFGRSLIQTGRLDLSPLFVVQVAQCLYSRTLAASHSIGSWENRWN